MLLRQIVGLSLCWLLLLGSLWDVAGPEHAHAADGHAEHASVVPAVVSGPAPQSAACHPSVRCIIVPVDEGAFLRPPLRLSDRMTISAGGAEPASRQPDIALPPPRRRV
ncbi:hypothetical protein [Limimaricola cinnabarinus]|jgi:hypothetical protein|uniref:hypothetical protein n=1 Tax=Limimaricola cinnabarinus TaxID=1125964 RepID=UPI002FE34C4E